ncbi:MAG: YveK family protein [Candidatus Margulisiibacteriota bacterium]
MTQELWWLDDVKAIFRKWYILVLFTLIGLGVAFLYNKSVPFLYLSRATLIVQGSSQSSSFSGYARLFDVSLPSDITDTTSRLLNSSRLSNRVVKLVAQKNNLEVAELEKQIRQGSIVIGQDKNFFTLLVTLPSPQLAQQMAQTYLLALNQLNVELELTSQKQFFIVIDEPSLGLDPVSPNKRLNLILGGVIGLLMGVLLALFVNWIQRLKATPEEGLS